MPRPLTPFVALLVIVGCAHGPTDFDPSARRTCVVLSVGGPDGVAHLGALEAVRAAGLRVDCVVGNSMGALIGALYASAPAEAPEPRFRAFIEDYRNATAAEAERNGLGLGLLLGGLAAAATEGVALPFVAALGGFALGAEATAKLDRERFVRVLDEFVVGARIEALPVRYATFHHEATRTGVVLRTVEAGSLADAVGASVANPLLFPRHVVSPGGVIDPGADRVSAVPVEDACRLFPDANLLAINVTGSQPFTSAAMTCPFREVRVSPSRLTPDDVLAFGEAYRRAIAAGRDATAAALRR